MQVEKYKGFTYQVDHVDGAYCGIVVGVSPPLYFTTYSFEDVPNQFRMAVDKHIREHLRSDTQLPFPK